VGDPHTGPALAVFAHPDDAEICAGGTLAKWAAGGREVHLLVLTNGDRGSSDPWRDRAELAATRRAETEAAGKILGLTTAHVLDVHDGELENTTSAREQVIRWIRLVRAETVISCDPSAWFFDDRYYNHSDHRKAGEIALDAVFPGAGNPHYFTEHLAEGLDVREVRDVWLGWTNEPNHIEDVTGHFRTMMTALQAHASQVEEGIRFFEEMLEKEARQAGAKIGTEHAESFRVLDLS
jgi:LmbE family N-acetylglucosaminyl deacetylase